MARGQGYSKYDPKRVERICRAIREGNSSEVAAQAAGIGKDTFYRWQREKPEFADAIAKARAECEVDWVGRLHNSDDNADTRWLLERTRRQRYGQRIEVVHRDAAARALLRELSEKLDTATFRRVVEALTDESSEGVPAGDALH